MDADLVLIFAFIIVITTIIGLTINGVVSKVLDYKRDKAGIPRFGAPAKKVEVRVSDHNEKIEERLANVERIVTDGSYRLSDEIEQLRERTLGEQKSEENA
ncbi:MAG: hypothetical protein AAFY42_03975 [Pseudomonadota bacterium]